MPLLDDALAAVRAQTTPAAAAPRNTFSADITLKGADVALETRLGSQSRWSTKLWADATWSGDYTAGLSLKGTF